MSGGGNFYIFFKIYLLDVRNTQDLVKNTSRGEISVYFEFRKVNFSQFKQRMYKNFKI